MNKKVVLSVLSTAVVASMAASAFAAPKDGLYIGGSVNKYYSTDVLLNMNATAKAAYANEVKSITDFNNLVFVDFAGKGASIQEILDEGLTAAKSEALVKEDFASNYAVATATGTTDGSYDARADVDGTTPGELTVESVSAINATKLEVKFGADVNPSDATDAGKYGIVGLTGINISGVTYDEETRTATVTLDAAIPNGTTFVVNVQPIESLEDSSAKTELYTKSLTFSDTVKPSFVSVTYPEAGVATLKFSEELSNKGTVKFYDGTTEVSLTNSLDSTDPSKLVVSGLVANKEYKVVILGAKDQSNNLISPNPTNVTIKSTVAETVPPTVASVTAVDYGTVKVQFSEKLKDIDPGAGVKYANVTVAGNAATGAQTFDTTTNTLTVVLGAGVAPTADGVYSVKVDGYKDLSDNAGADFTKAVSFVAGAPVLEKTEVKTIAGVKTAVLTFNEDVTFNGGEITGTLTTPENVLKTIGTAVIDETAVTGDVSTSGKELRIALTDAAFETGTYNLTILAGDIEDAGGVASTADTNFTFTLTGNVDTTQPQVVDVYLPGENATAVGGPASVPLNEVYVKYDRAMGASAVNKDNYAVEAAKVFSNAVFVTDKTLVKLTLTAGAIQLSGDQEFTVSTAVKGENNVAVKPHASTESFVENVLPTFAAASLIDGTNIKVTFSEVMDAASLEDGDDFDVIVNGLKKTVSAVAAAGTAGANDDEFIITFTTALTPEELATGTIQAKLLDGSDATDVATNPVVDNVTKTVTH